MYVFLNDLLRVCVCFSCTVVLLFVCFDFVFVCLSYVVVCVVCKCCLMCVCDFLCLCMVFFCFGKCCCMTALRALCTVVLRVCVMF